jgi:hypothetical protein
LFLEVNHPINLPPFRERRNEDRLYGRSSVRLTWNLKETLGFLVSLCSPQDSQSTYP